MKIFVLIFFVGFLSAQAQKPVPLILDTDIAPDYDDVGAMALLHALADNGEAEILATISCNAFETTAPTLSVLNTYYGRTDIPIGITKSNNPNMNCGQKWAEAIVSQYPHALRENADAKNAIKLYRSILSTQPDKSVTIITIGFFTNLAGLLDSAPDEFSNLNGKQLIERKVKQLVSMAAGTGRDGKGFREYNVLVDAPASGRVFRDWPTPMLISGFEIGEKILTGARLAHDDKITGSPVKDAFRIALTKDNNTVGRNSWDETAVLVAVRGVEPYFGTRTINFKIEDDGTSTVTAGSRYLYLTEKMPAGEVAKVIEDLMMQPPKRH